jgi:hypothetical protein
VLNIATFSIWETSLGPMRWSSELADTSFWEVGNLIRTDKPAVIVAIQDDAQDSRSVSWRVASYYERRRDIWVLHDSATPEARKIRGREVLEIRKETPLEIPVPKGARIIWLIDPASDFMAAAKSQVPVNLSRKYVMFTDLPENGGSFTIGQFVFRPS